MTQREQAFPVPDHEAAAARRRGRGRPFRFLAFILLLWAGGRIMALHYAHDDRPAPSADMMASQPPSTGADTQKTGLRPDHSIIAGQGALGDKVTISAAAPPVPTGRESAIRTMIPFASQPSAALTAHGNGASLIPHAMRKHFVADKPPVSPGLPVSPPAPRHRKDGADPGLFLSRHERADNGTAEAERKRAWSASAWILWRDRGSAAAIQNYGQLGGAQAGLRVDRQIGALSGALPLRAYGRLSRALHRPGQAEAATGFSLGMVQESIAVSLHGERRIKLEEGGRDAFALFMTGGINPLSVTGPVELEGYAQAGIVGLRRRDGFVDGRISLTTPMADIYAHGHGPRMGISLSGGVQPGLSRLDIGPVLDMRLPVGSASPRLSVEWRERIAGLARPGSGPVLTLSGDF